MEIVGHGFLAGHLAAIGHGHQDAVAIAAGVSWGSATSEVDFARETELVLDTARRCRRDGRRLVFFSPSSAAIYGPGHGVGREDDPVIPASPYGRHKVALEERVRESG